MKRISTLGSSIRTTIGVGRKNGAVEDDIASPGSGPCQSSVGTEEHTAPTNMSLPPTPTKPSPAPTLIGKAWKRRGGVAGKLSAKAPSAWELRDLHLVGTRLIYYSSDDAISCHERTEEEEIAFSPESNPASPQSQTSEGSGVNSWFDKAKSTAGSVTTNLGSIITHRPSTTSNNLAVEPRGYLDLREAETRVYASFGHSGAPSPFCLSFQVGLAKETKWKLAFDTLQEQMEWLAAVSTVIIQGSVDEYNGLLLRAASVQTVNQQIEGGALFVHQPSVREPPAPAMDDVGSVSCGLDTSTDSSHTAGAGGSHRLWMMESYSVQYTEPYAPLTTLTKEQQVNKKELENAVAESNKSLMMLYQQSQMHASQLQAQVKKMKEDHEAVLESLRSELSAAADATTTKEQDAQTINALRDVIAKLQSANDEKLAALEEKHRTEVDGMRKELLTQQAAAQDSSSQTLADEVYNTAGGDSKMNELVLQVQQLTLQNGELLKARDNNFLTQRMELEEEFQRKLSEQKHQLEAISLASQNDGDAKLDDLQRELGALREEHDQLQYSFKMEQEKQLELQRNDFEAQLEALRANHSSHMESIRLEHSLLLTSLKTEIADLQLINQDLTEKLKAAQLDRERLTFLLESNASRVDATDEEEEDDFEDCIADE